MLKKMNNRIIAWALCAAMLLSFVPAAEGFALEVGDTKNHKVSSETKDDFTMLYNAKPEVSETGWISENNDAVAISFSEEMSISGRYSILNMNNYLISGDGGKTWIEASKLRIRNYEAANGNKKAIIRFYDRLGEDKSKIQVKVLTVADSTDKTSLKEVTIVKVASYTIDSTRIKNITVVNSRLITFETDFRIKWISPWAITYNANYEIGVMNAEYKNTEKGATVSIFLSNYIPVDSDLKNIKYLNLGVGALIDEMDVYNLLPIKLPTEQIVDGIAPSVTEAYSVDGDFDGHIDGVNVVFNEDMKLASTKTSDITVLGYNVRGLVAKDRMVLISLDENKNFDTDSKLYFKLFGKVTDLAGNTPKGDEDGFLAKDGCNPVVVSAEVLSEGKTKGFGNDVEDGLMVRFSEPVYSKFSNGKYPDSSELQRVFGYIEKGRMIDIFISGNFSVKDISTYPSKDFVIIVNGTSETNIIRRGGLLRTVDTGFLVDQAGLGISKNQMNIKVK